MQVKSMADSFLGAGWNGCYFDGVWRRGKEDIIVTEPATGVPLAIVGSTDPVDVAKIAGNALEAQRGWSALPPAERARILRNAGALMERHMQEIATWVCRETGGTSFKSGFEVKATADELYVAASLLIQPPGLVLQSDNPQRSSIANRVPLGVVGVIAPWNVPLGLAIRSVAPALALGNAVVLKPDPQTPVAGGVVLARIFAEAGVPPGVFNLVNGGAGTGEALCVAPAVRMISFTGSTAVGRRVGELAGRHLKKVTLELGGNCPLLVLDDADLEAAASAGAFGSFFHQGQICMATSRHIVDRSVAAQYVEILMRKAAALVVGNPVDPKVMIGPLINAKQRDRVHRIVSESITAGATLDAGGSFDGLFYKPTVLSRVSPSMPAFSEEIFGPVASVTLADDEDHAVDLANQTDYGLAAAVQTGSQERGLRIAGRIRAGMVHVNDQTINDTHQAPMGGVGQSGNGSRFSSMTAWEEFTEWRWVTSSKVPSLFPF